MKPSGTDELQLLAPSEIDLERAPPRTISPVSLTRSKPRLAEKSVGPVDGDVKPRHSATTSRNTGNDPMRFVLSLLLCLMAAPWIAPRPATAQDTIVTPPKGTALRADLLDTARPAFEQEVGAPVEFVVHTLNVMDGWAFGSVKPQRPGGVAIDWRRTKFGEDVAQGMFETEISFFLLRDAGDGWKLIEIAIGPTDVAWDWWRQQHRLPAELFGASSADFPPLEPAQRPRPGG